MKYHMENDGPRVLRHGLEAFDEDIDLAFIEKEYPHRVVEVKAALERVRLRVV
jgi:hypothetical protein